MSTRDVPNGVPLDLASYLGDQITLAIVDEQEHGGQPDISLFIGILGSTEEGFEIVASRDSIFQIPSVWLPKVKIMDEEVKDILGGSDLLLSIPKQEFENAGISYTVDANSAIDIEVRE
jgi:hypothetical protein